MKTLKLIAILLAVFAVAAQAATYYITGSGTSFTARKDNIASGTVVGTANATITNVVDAIRTDANGTNCTIQFGDGTDALNVSPTHVSFSGSATPTWGVITLQGKITTTYGGGSSDGLISVSNGASIVVSTAEIVSAATYESHAIRNNGGTVTINGGTVSASAASTRSYAVSNSGTGTVTINGGTLSASYLAVTNSGTGAVTISGGTFTGGVSNTSTGTINISGGTVVNASTGALVSNSSTGTINISGGTVSTTGGNTSSTFTVANGSTITAAAGTINISGGEVSATTAATVFNSGGTINISGGEVSATTGIAVRHYSSNGKVTVSGAAKVTSANTSDGTISIASSGTATAERLVITGGTVENTAADANARAIYNVSTGAVTISGGTVSAASGTAVYNYSTGTVIVIGGTVTGGTQYTNDNANGTIVRWTSAAPKTYTAFASTDLTVEPATATAAWRNNGSNNAGIGYTNASGANTGFVAVSGVTVSKLSGTFASLAAINTTYTSSLTLAGVTLPTGYAWVTPTTALSAGDNQTFAATYTDPSGNYNAANGNITVNVAKATPAALTWPTAAAITYGAALSASALSGGVGAGSFAWAAPATIPTVTNSGYSVTFTPTDAANYDWSGVTLAQTVAITVSKANPTVTWPSSAAITYGQTLANAVFAGHSGTGTFAYTSGATSPSVAQSGTAYQVTFTPTDAANYNTLTQNVAITVNKASGLINEAPPHLMISISNPAPHTYSLSTIALSKDDHGELTYSLGAFADGGNNILSAAPTLGADGHTLTYTGNGKTSGTATQVINVASQNYTDLAVTITFEAVNKTEVTIGGITAVPTYVYDGTPKTGYTGTATSGAYTGALVYEYAGTDYPQTTTPPTNVGEYTLRISVPETSPDYTGQERYEFVIEKATPATPTGLTATVGQTLANVTLPAGWEWATPTAAVGAVGVQTHKADYTPSDAVNYNALQNIDVSVTVSDTPSSSSGGDTDPIRPTQMASSNIRVQTTSNTIMLENLPSNAKVEVYNMQGKRIYSAYPENPKILRIGVQTKGIYIVKINTQTMRVAVR